MSTPYRKKIIEVALRREAINKALARQKSIRPRHPSMLHLWRAWRPLAAAAAVIFAQMVDDPSSRPERLPTEEPQEKERQRLFRLIEELVQWEDITNEDPLWQAREKIWKISLAACVAPFSASRTSEGTRVNHDPTRFLSVSEAPS